MTNPMQCERCGKPHTTSQGNPSCSGHRKRVTPLSPCTNDPMHDQRVCRMHGGKASQNMAAGQRRAAQAEATRLLWSLDAPPVEDAVDALQRFAGRLLAAEQVVGSKVNELSSLRFSSHEGAEQLRGEVQLLMELLKLIRQTLDGMAKLNLDERRVRLSEQLGASLIAFVEGYTAALAEVFGFDPADPRIRPVAQVQLAAIEGSKT